MSKPLSLTAFALVAALGGLTAAGAAEAGTRERTRAVQGPNGHGFIAERSAARSPGAASRSVRRTYNNGAIATGAASATWGDGAASYQRSHTGAQGATQSSWGTVYRTDDGYVRSHGAAGSNGRSYSATKDISVSDDVVTVTRDLTTGSGAAHSHTSTYSRGR